MYTILLNVLVLPLKESAVSSSRDISNPRFVCQSILLNYTLDNGNAMINLLFA